MKNIKYVLILLLIIIFTGCDAKYEIEIYNNEVIEDFSFLETNSSIWDSIINNEVQENSESTESNVTYRILLEEESKIKTPAFISGDNLSLEKKLISKANSLGLKTNYDYSVLNYKDAFLPNSCFKYFNFLSNEETYVLSTSEGINCFKDYDKLDNLDIVVTTNHKVKKTNADMIEKDSYIWKVNKENADSTSLYIELYKDDFVFNYKNRVVYTVLGIIGVAFLIFIVIIILRKRAKRNNKI